MATSTSIACSARTASAAVSRIVSATPRVPRTSPSHPARKAVFPLLSIRSMEATYRSGMCSPRSATSFGLPTITSVPSTVPATPRPRSVEKSLGVTKVTSRSSAPRATALPIGCSDAASTDPTSSRKRSSGSSVTTSVRVIAPRVRVPVLSKMTVSTTFACSKT